MQNLSLVLKTLQRTGIAQDKYHLPHWSIPVVKSVMSCRVLRVHHCVLKPSGSGEALQDPSKNPILMLCRLGCAWVGPKPVIALSLHPGLKLGRPRLWHTNSSVLSPPFPYSCPPQAVLCSCRSDPASGRVRGMSGALAHLAALVRTPRACVLLSRVGGVSWGNPTKHVLVPAVQAE